MTLIIRIFFEYFRSKFSRKTNLNEEIISQFRVMPTDLDFNGHMTNNRYHTIMDYSALHLLGSHGILAIMFSKKWRPIVGCSLVSHRRSLQMFQEYSVRSKVIYCDALWTYISHIIEYDGKTIAAGNRKYALLGRGGQLINSKKIFSELGEDYQNRPSEIDSIRSWIDAEKTVLKQSQEENKNEKISETDQDTAMVCKKNAIVELLKKQDKEIMPDPCLYAGIACAKSVGCTAKDIDA